MSLKLGMIGMSPGNGHPYSWSAIFNGYDKQQMESCPFPAIPEYLSRQTFPDDAIAGARVTHVWTQDDKISKHIAKACHIDNIVDNYLDMTDKVDAVLLARDDAELHLKLSEPFLRAGLPIYIDKPLSLTVEGAKSLFALQRYEGQLFTCTALRFAKEFQLEPAVIEELGKIQYVDACVVKSWEKYAIHVVEPVLNIIGEQGALSEVKTIASPDLRIVINKWESGVYTLFTTHEKTDCPIVIRIFGDKGYKELAFEDTFYAFKSSLQAFIDSVLTGINPISQESVLKTIQVIERGQYGQ